VFLCVRAYPLLSVSSSIIPVSYEPNRNGVKQASYSAPV
jgi:hypothetical protein